MKRRLVSVWLGASAFLGCGGGTSVVKVYERPNPAHAPYSTLLVVGVHDDRAIRRQFEDALARALDAAPTRAVASNAVMGAETVLDATAVQAAAQATNADAVLITRLVDVRTESEVEEGRVSATAERRDDTIVDFFRYDYVEYQDPMTISTVHTVICATDLYDVRANAKTWSIESTAFEKETATEVIADISAVIRSQLARDGLIR
jgi:hypothetical protein